MGNRVAVQAGGGQEPATEGEEGMGSRQVRVAPRSRRRLRRASDSNVAEASSSGWVWKNLAHLLALTSILLSLIGFGVVLGVADAVGLDQGLMISSPFDLLTLLWPSALIFLTAATNFEWGALLLEFGAQSSWVALGVMALGILLPWPKRLVGLVQRCRTRLGPAVSLAAREEEKPWSQRLLSGVVLGTGLGVVVTIGQVVGVWAIRSVLLVVALLPILGFSAGGRYVRELVKEPAHCSATPTWAQINADRTQTQALAAKQGGGQGKPATPKQSGARCVMVRSLDPGRPFALAGRSVLSSSSLLLLWDPATGRGYRVPISGMEVSSIDDEALAGTRAAPGK